MDYIHVLAKLTDLKCKLDLSNIQGSKLIITPVKIHDISNKFPDFYKMFLTEIGTVYLSHFDQFIFEVSLPKNTNEFWFLNEDFVHDETTLIFHSDDQEIIYLILDSEFRLSAKSSVKNINAKEFSSILSNILDGILSSL